MTLLSTQVLQTYLCDNITTVFPVPFPFFDKDELLVVETSASGVETVKSLNLEYNVVGGDGLTGSVIAVSAPPATVKWTIKRKTSLTQEVDYTPNDPFPAETHERALDRSVAMIQELKETIGRTVTIPISSTLSNIKIPLPGHGKFWRWDITGTYIEAVDVTSLGMIGLPITIANGGTSATTKNGALTNLNLTCLKVVKFRNFI